MIKIDYIEFSIRDMAEAKQFYGGLFGWQFTDYGETYAGFHYGDGKEWGGFEVTDEPVVSGSPLVVLYADDLESIYAAVVAAGATITQQIFSFPGGRRFHFQDASGNDLAIWSK